MKTESPILLKVLLQQLPVPEELQSNTALAELIDFTHKYRKDKFLS